jgi:ribosomal protein L12E/L44/L45/RPP1/RPP2
MLRKSIALSLLLCAVLVLGAAELATAQATETVRIRATGTLMGKSGETLVVDVTEGKHLGMRKFSWKDMQNVKFYNRLGQEVQPNQLHVDSILTVEYDETREVPVVVTMTEVQQMDEVAEVASAPAPAAAPAPAPAAAPAPAPAPATLPSTASSLPLVLLLGLMVLTIAATLAVVRRS